MADQTVSLPWIVGRHAREGAVTEIRVIRRTESGERSICTAIVTPETVDLVLAEIRPRTPEPRKRIPPNDHPREGEANFYFTLNGVNPELANGQTGRISRVKHAVADRDICVSSLFLIDLDPERPSSVSATDNEKELALEVAESIADWLAQRGVGGIRADSGNGGHLLVPLIPYRGEDVQRAAQDAHDLLKLLDARFTRPGVVKVDTGNFNPARITKLYGTLAVKGPNTKERPHRYSSIDLSSVPPDIDLFAVLRDEIEDYRRVNGGGRKAAVGSGRERATAERSGDQTGDRTEQENDSPNAVKTRRTGRSGRVGADAWRRWKGDALAALPLEAVYGELLTGKVNNDGWLECRDPDSPTGDRNPSAGVADGSGSSARGTFHSFRTGESLSVFDFLVERGRVADFRAACAWVAERSGVPLPGRVQDIPDAFPERDAADTEPFDLDLLDAFLKTFRAEQDRKRRLELLRGFLGQLVQAPALEQQIALAELHNNTGYPLQALKRTLAELQRDDEGEALDEPPPDVPVIDLVRGQEALSSFFKRLVRFLRPLEQFYNRQGNICYIQRSLAPVAVTEGNLSGLLAGVVEFRMFQRAGGRRQLLGYEPLPPHLCKALVNSPRARQLLPPLATWSQAPFFATDWTFIGKAGYYPADGGIFYDGPPVKPRRSTSVLEALTRGSFWKSPADKVNFLGAMLTGLTMPHWVNGHAVVMVNGNRTGIGKSILVQAIALVTDGRKSRSISFELNQTEFEKQLATEVDRSGRIIFIDNIKLRRPVESAVLERLVTDWLPNFRRLGTNSSITRDQNDLLICLTMNEARLGPDMRRRVLPINLHVEGPLLKHKEAVPEPKSWLLKHRLELVAELAGMVQVWLAAGRPMEDAPARHTTSDEWASTIDAILRANGYEGFLSNYDESMGAFDAEYQVMVQICREHRQVGSLTASAWAELLGEGLLRDRFRDRHGEPKLPHAQTQILGRLFNAYLERPLEVDGELYLLVRSLPHGQHRPPEFRFDKNGVCP